MTRYFVYSSLAVPLVVLAGFLASMNPAARKGFFFDLRHNTTRMLAGDWEFVKASPPTRSRAGRQSRGVAPEDIFRRFDKDQDQQLDASELGKRLQATLLGQERTIDQRRFLERWHVQDMPLNQDGELADSPVTDKAIQDTVALATHAAARLPAAAIYAADRVVTVEIKMEPTDWDALRHQSRDFRSAVDNPLAKPYTYFPADVTVDGVFVRRVGIRKKGFIGSQDTIRPSLKISFSKYDQPSPAVGFDQLTLNNNRQDISLASQRLTYELFRRVGVAAPRCNYAVVTVNGTYLGVYSNVESVRKPFLLANFGDDSGNLYEGTLTDFYPKSMEWFEAKTNVRRDDRTKITALAELLDDENVSTEAIAKFVDIDQFLKFWAVESLISFWDGYTQHQNNYFVYDNPENGKLYFVPWGADSCFGQGRGDAENSSAVGASSILAHRLYHDPAIQERYRQTMLAVLETAWNDQTLLEQTDQAERLFFDHIGLPQAASLLALDDMRRYIRSRRQRVLSDLNQHWPVPVQDAPRTPMYLEQVGSASGNVTLGEADPGDAQLTSLVLTINEDAMPISAPAIRRHQRQPADPATNQLVTTFTIYGQWSDRPVTLTLTAIDVSSPQPATLQVHGTLYGVTGDVRRRNDELQVQGTITLHPDTPSLGLDSVAVDVTIHERRGGFNARRW